MKAHWDQIYNKKSVESLGWYEEHPGPSLQLISKCNLGKEALILSVGAGATTLVDELLRIGHLNIVANDVSAPALDKIKARLGDDSASKVRWIVDDIINPAALHALGPVDLWHDRAVLHFFNDLAQQDRYFNLLRNLVKVNGYVIIAVFNLDGARKCSGLPVFRYNQEMLQLKLGKDFDLMESFDHTYIMPSGDSREYIYTLFRRAF